METITLIDALPSARDYNRLREAVGWKPYPLEIIKTYLPHSLFGVCALHADEVVGMARVIGDGGLVFYIQDVIVLPDYQGQGIGRRMIDRVMAYLGTHTTAGSIVGLMAATGKEGFYEKYGFTVRPTERLGAGMTQFWQKRESAETSGTRVLVLCDDRWHPAATVRAGLAPLAAEGFSFEAAAHTRGWPAGRLAAYPLVVLAKANNISAADETPWATPEIGAAFVDYVRQGGGLVVVHSGTAGYDALASLRGLMGGAFAGHPPQCPVTVTPQPGHPLTAGSEPFTLMDEHYAVTLDDAQVEVFLTTASAAGEQPGGWRRQAGVGRVCVLTPGHNLEVWLHPAYQALLRNALRWAGPRTV